MRIPAQHPDETCLFLDVDGTLIDLAPTPDSVVVPVGLVDAIRRIERMFGGALAFVSGRSIDQIDRLFHPLTLKAAGGHGAEFRFVADRESERWRRAGRLPDQVWDDLSALLRDFPGTLTENKDFSYAVHYRATPDSAGRLRTALDGFLASHGEFGLQILPGHFVYELKQSGIDKGAAIRTFMERDPFAGRNPIFIGDDVTDAPGFVAVTELGGHAYSVGKPFPAVEATFADPAAVREWLADLVGQETVTA